jgi:hypothetical protein
LSHLYDFSHKGECRGDINCECESFTDEEGEKQFIEELNKKREKEAIL